MTQSWFKCGKLTSQEMKKTQRQKDCSDRLKEKQQQRKIVKTLKTGSELRAHISAHAVISALWSQTQI